MSRSVRQALAERTAGSVTKLKAEGGSPVSNAKRRRKRGRKGQIRAQGTVAAVCACNAQSEAYADLPGRRWPLWASC